MTGNRLLVSLLLVPLIAGSLMTSVASADTGPALSTPPADLDNAVACPATFSNPQRQPVLLVHGTTVTPEENWEWNYAKVLPTLGYDVCTVRLPGRALGDIQVSAEYVVHAVRTISSRTDGKVDVVGLSQGGLVPRWAIKWWPDVRALVDDYVGIVSPNHGTVFSDVTCPFGCAPALWQMSRSSAFLEALNRGDETPGDVAYTSVYSVTDQFVQPQAPAEAASSPLAGGSNIAIQDVCPGRVVDHVNSTADAAVFEVVMDALRHVGPADPDRVSRLGCFRTFMPGVHATDAAAANGALYGVIFPQYLILGETSDSEPPPKDYAREG